MPISPIPIPFSPCLNVQTVGPAHESKPARDKYPHLLNETASLTDHVFKDHLDLFSSIPVLVLEKVPSEEEIIEKYGDMIDQHVERRISFFFQQLVACYQTKLHFETESAQNQGDSPEKVCLVDKKKKSISFQRNAAHSQTIPLLVAYNPQEWARYESGGGAKPAGFTFLKGTDSYRLWNATMNMPRWVNNADINIDGTASNEKLRKSAMALVNRSANGDLTPEAGLEQFIDLCKKQVQAGIKSLPSNKGAEKAALNRYLAKLKEIKAEYAENREEMLEALLDISLDDLSDPVFRKIVYQIRYRAIRDSQLEQSKVIKKIDEVRMKILGTYARKPAHFDGAFRTILVETGRDTREKQRLGRLYNFSPHDFQARLKPAQKTLFTKTKADLLAKHGKIIQEVALSSLHDMRTLMTEEATQRARITKELRRAKQWTQKELGEEVKKRFQNAAASQSTISRIENKIKLVTPQVANELSSVFSIDAGLFMPHFFYE